MFLELRGEMVHTSCFGDGARTIVGVSGAFGNMEIWQQPFELLSRKHRVISYDHFGTGETRVAAERVTFEEQVSLLEALLDAMSVERCVLAGDSQMAGVAVEFAATRPERVEALALVSGSMSYRASRPVLEFVEGLRTDFDATIARFVEWCIPEGDSLHLRPWLRDIIARTGGERAATILESFYGIDVSHRLTELRMPAVVIHGERDVMPGVTTDAARQAAAAMPTCTLEVIAGAGHVPTLTRPREVAAIIERLIEGSGG